MAKKISFVNADKNEFYPVLKQRVDEYFKQNGNVRNANFLLKFKVAFYLVTLFSAWGALVFAPLPLWAVYGCWLVIGLFSAFIGLGVCHDAIHGSLFKSSKVNKIFGWVFNLVGANMYMWEIMHNRVHHSFTNIEGHDADLESVPFLRMSPHKKLKKIHKIQHWLALPTYGLATISWVFIKDYVKFANKKVGSYEIKKHPKGELFRLILGKVIYYTVFIVIPFTMIDIPWYHLVLAFLASHWIEGFTLAIIFMLAHIVEEVHYPLPDENGKIHKSWAAHQLYTTADFATGNPLVSFFCGGLNFQVEHHLFPQVSHVHLPAISKITRETAKEFGLPYYEHPTVFSALRSHLRLLKILGSKEHPFETSAAEMATAKAA